MAYFPNGTAGQILDDQCDGCLHGVSDGIMCPVAYIQINFNYKQLDKGNESLRAVMNKLINEAGVCQMKAAMDKAGITFDSSGKEQLPLFDCNCRMSDAWKCAVDQGLVDTIACQCMCHKG